MSSVKCQVSGKLGAIDRRILNRLQEDIPFEACPWEKIAKELNIDTVALLKRVDFLKKKGIIRRIAATFNPKKMGFVSTLVAAKIASRNIDMVARAINKYPEVTHNYKRAAEFNLWFTLVAPTRKRIFAIINELKNDHRIEKILELPAIRLFKIDVNLKV